MRHACKLLTALLVAACEPGENGPRPRPEAVEACRREPEPSLSEFCDQSRDVRRLCERYASYDDALAGALQDCADTGFPLAIAACSLRAIDRSGPAGELRMFYDEAGALVGVFSTTDQVFDCPEGSPRARSVSEQRAGRVEDDCEPCLVCGVQLDDAERQVCGGELGAPYVERCRDAFEFHAQCEPCACQHCYPFTYTELRETAELFHHCVEDRCDDCARAPLDASVEQPGEDAGR